MAKLLDLLSFDFPNLSLLHERYLITFERYLNLNLLPQRGRKLATEAAFAYLILAPSLL
jgi:hypothetical protein